MPIEWLLAIVIGAALGVLLWTRRPKAAAALQAPPADRTATPATLEPGGVLTFWDGHAAIASTALDCAEELHGRVARWRWLLLDDGNVLQVIGETLTLFERSVLLQQGTQAFGRFTAPLADGGLLQQFEARVRDGTLAREPVRWWDDGEEYELRSTGTFQATWRGAPLGPVWADVSDAPSDNVYFTFEGRGGAVDGVVGLGVWTTHMLLLFGRPLQPADVVGCYQPGDASALG